MKERYYGSQKEKVGLDPENTYVEPIERKSSVLPLLIGVLLALALAYFVLQRFMHDDPEAVQARPVPFTQQSCLDSAGKIEIEGGRFYCRSQMGTVKRIDE